MRLSRLFLPIFFLFVLVGVFIGLLPTLISSDWGRRQAIKWINYSIPGQLEIRSLKLQWSKGQVIEGLLLKDPEGQQVLGIEYFSTETPLWKLLKEKLPLGFSQIKDLNAVIITNENGESNLQRALGTTSSRYLPPLSASPISLSDVHADLSLFSKHQPFSAYIKGKTHQENLSGSFEISLILPTLHASNWEELKKKAEHSFSLEGGKEGEIRARIVNFPIDLIDRLTALQAPHLSGLFRSILGDRLNISIDKENDPQGLAFHLMATTPFMQGKVKGKIVDEQFFLQEPSLFQLHLIPESINAWMQQAELLKPAQIKLAISELAFPLAFLNRHADVDPSQISLQAKVEAPDTELDLETLGIWNLSKCKADIHAPFSQSDLQVEIAGKAQEKQEPFSFSFTLREKKPRHAYALLESFEQSGKDISLSLADFPLSLLSGAENSPLEEMIGSYLDVQMKFNSHKREEWLATMTAQTERLTIQELPFRIGKDIHLTAPSEVNMVISPSSLDLFSEGKLRLKEPCNTRILLKQLNIPLENIEASQVNIEANLHPVELTDAIIGETLKINQLNLKVEGQNLHTFSSALTAHLALLSGQDRSASSPLLEAPLQLEQIASWKIHSNKQLEMTSGTLQLSNADHLLQAEGKITPEGLLTWTQPIKMNYKLTSQALERLACYLKLEEPYPQLQETSHIQLTIDPASIPLSSLSLASLQMKGVLTMDHLALQDQSQTLPYLKQLSLPWAVNGATNTFTAHFKGMACTQINNKTKSSPLVAYLFVGDWLKEGMFNLSQSLIEAKLNLSGLPISLLNIFTHQFSKQIPPDLNLVLGPLLDIDLRTSIDLSWKQPGYWDMYLDSTYFHARTQVKLDQALTFYGTEKPSELRFTLTPQSYEYLKNWLSLPHEGKLAAPVTLAGYLSNLYIPLKDILSDQRRFDIQFSTSDIQWQEDKSSPIKLQGQIGSQDLNQSIHFSLQAKSSSLLSIQGIVSHLFDEAGQPLSWRENGWDIKVAGQKLTPFFLKNLFLLNEETAVKIAALFGESLDVQLSTQIKDISGPLQAVVKGTKGEASLDGELKKGILTLHSPLKGHLQVTPLLSQAFLTKNFPLLRSAIKSESPITFQIDPDQFSFPLVPFEWNQATIHHAVIDLNKIYFRNEGELHSSLSFLPSLSRDILTIWFTPLHLQLDQGLLNLKRVDLLLDETYPLAGWGKVNLNRHQADLVVGLSAQSLQSAFGIQGLDKTYFLQIPIHTVDGKVEMNKKKATARVSALIAQTKGGSKGKLLGSLLELVAADEGEEGAIPPPMTSPLPWEDRFNASSLSENEKEKKGEKEEFASTPSLAAIPRAEKKKKKKKDLYQELDLLKGVQEGATEILDRLLR